MRILDIRERSASIESDIANAYINFSKMTVSVVAVVTDQMLDGKPLVGFGFSSNGRYAQGGILRERLIPRIMEADPDSLLDADGILNPVAVSKAALTNEKPGGHGDRAVAMGALDMAIWDATAKAAGQPLWKLLSERYSGGRADETVMVYPGGGYYYPGKGLDALQDEMRGYQDDGYSVVKMKIGGAPLKDDVARIEAVLKVVGGGHNLAVDANGRFDLEAGLAYAKAITPFELFWYEEIGDPLDYALNAAVSELYPGPIATGENLFSHQDLRNLLRYGGMRPDRDWIQLDPALSYGLTEYLNVLAVVDQMGWSRRRFIPHGGHQLALNMAAGLGLGGSESYPGVFHPFGGFADDCVIRDGRATLHDTPGLGVELKQVLHAHLRDILELD